MPVSALKVTSHVARDLLQSAALFRHEHSVVWEYVSNGLQYKDPSTKPIVVVTADAKSKRIEIRDNGRGMLISDLKHYFVMHGENVDRKQGRPGRGYFGTGKSAAFGIANTLRITTVRNGRLSKVQLTRKGIEECGDGEEIPVQILQNEAASSAPNGTVIEIEDVFLRQIDIPSMIRHIERHIAHWPDATVLVNNHECQFNDPDINQELTFSTKGTPFEKLLGTSELKIKVAKAPLDEELRGIAILSQGVWHETTLAGCDRKPFAEYLFGTIDVPTIALDQSPTPAFDMSRSMKLNPRNEIVAETLRFIGVNLETIRKELERKDRERRQTEEQKRLQQQGAKIAEIINHHFKNWSAKLRKTMAKAGTGKDLLPSKERTPQSEEGVIRGDELLGIVLAGGRRGDPDGETDPNPGPALNENAVKLDEQADQKVARRHVSMPNHGISAQFKACRSSVIDGQPSLRAIMSSHRSSSAM